MAPPVASPPTKVQDDVGWQGTNGMLQTCGSDIKKNAEDMYRSLDVSHHDHLPKGIKLESHGYSSSAKIGDLRDLLPGRKIQSFNKRTPRSGKTCFAKGDASKCLHSDHMVYRRKPDGDSFFYNKHVEKGANCVKINSSILVEGFKEESRKITKDYVRKKHRQSHLEEEGPDLHNLLLLADTAISYSSEQKCKETSLNGHNDHQSSTANCGDPTFKMPAERMAEQALTTEASPDHILKDSQPELASVTEQVSAEDKQISYNSTYENQMIKQDLPRRVSGDELSASSQVTEFQLSEGCVLRKLLVTQILTTSKLKATSMVDLALKILSSLKGGEDAYAMIGKALDSEGIVQAAAGSRISEVQHCHLQNEGSKRPHHLLCNYEDIAASVQYTTPIVGTSSSKLSELISACVAALLMIQTCSNTRLPPAEAVEILEHAARILQPRCSQNLHIYSEIEQLMTIIKTQVLALQPVPGASLQV
ncbi:Protein always early 2 [Apostasia shenzhenica]|uniref:Protein always early 2 n=1 Tax=Apostasia shenzhenica TaxID=1088818 RepID=A0A2I0ALK2_9ASPA|nr:Protein always early 2 [Apostasia shenzhenica]